jgi:hypothetical protein
MHEEECIPASSIEENMQLLRRRLSRMEEIRTLIYNTGESSLLIDK